jgi:hypothetical protein
VPLAGNIGVFHAIPRAFFDTDVEIRADVRCYPQQSYTRRISGQPIDLRLEHVPSALSIEPITPLDGSVGEAYTRSFTVTGGTPPYTLSRVGAALSGLEIKGQSLTGVPTAQGPVTLRLSADDACGYTTVKDFTFSLRTGDRSSLRVFVDDGPIPSNLREVFDKLHAKQGDCLMKPPFEYSSVSRKSADIIVKCVAPTLTGEETTCQTTTGFVIGIYKPAREAYQNDQRIDGRTVNPRIGWTNDEVAKAVCDKIEEMIEVWKKGDAQ